MIEMAIVHVFLIKKKEAVSKFQARGWAFSMAAVTNI